MDLGGNEPPRARGFSPSVIDGGVGKMFIGAELFGRK